MLQLKKLPGKWLIVYYRVQNSLPICNNKNEVKYDPIKHMNTWPMCTSMGIDKERKHIVIFRRQRREFMGQILIKWRFNRPVDIKRTETALSLTSFTHPVLVI